MSQQNNNYPVTILSFNKNAKGTVIAKPDKKLKAIIDGTKTIHFGQKSASDFTIHRDDERKQRYINRHEKKENWKADGFKTAGFYAKNILWNKKTLKAFVNDLNHKFKSLHVSLK
jgi:hypothetical protein